MPTRDQYVTALRVEATRPRDKKHLQEIREEIASVLGIPVTEVTFEEDA